MDIKVIPNLLLSTSLEIISLESVIKIEGSYSHFSDMNVYRYHAAGSLWMIE